MWFHSSVGRATHRQRGGHGFESRWSPDFFFFRLLLSNCLNWKIHCDDHSSLSSTTAVQIWIISYTGTSHQDKLLLLVDANTVITLVTNTLWLRDLLFSLICQYKNFWKIYSQVIYLLFIWKWDSIQPLKRFRLTVPFPVCSRILIIQKRKPIFDILRNLHVVQ